VLSGSAQSLSTEEKVYFSKYQDSLQKLQKLVFSTKNDSVELAYNRKFLALWDVVLSNQKSFYFAFDSLKEVSRLTSEDEKFRIINWNLLRDDGTHYYFGFVQVKNETGNGFEVFKLLDKSPSIKNPENHISKHSNWFGMLYYKIIKCNDYYLLFGWDENDKLTSRKFIDVISFANGDPIFGKDVFSFKNKNPKRIMFEFSSELTMSLMYYKEKDLIVFDHLAPKDPLLEGQYQFYGPDFSLDAFEYKKGVWVYDDDIDIKNKKNKNDDVKANKEKKDRPIYTPK